VCISVALAFVWLFDVPALLEKSEPVIVEIPEITVQGAIGGQVQRDREGLFINPDDLEILGKGFNLQHELEKLNIALENLEASTARVENARDLTRLKIEIEIFNSLPVWSWIGDYPDVLFSVLGRMMDLNLIILNKSYELGVGVFDIEIRQ